MPKLTPTAHSPESIEEVTKRMEESTLLARAIAETMRARGCKQLGLLDQKQLILSLKNVESWVSKAQRKLREWMEVTGQYESSPTPKE